MSVPAFPADVAGQVRVTRERGLTTVVWLVGEHDLSTVDAVTEAFAAVMAAGSTDVVVDLSGVGFMGASTVGVLVDADRLFTLYGGSLKLRSPSRCAARVVEVCGLTAMLTVAPATGRGALASWVAVPTEPVSGASGADLESVHGEAQRCGGSSERANLYGECGAHGSGHSP